MISVVFDTNIYVQAMLGQNGPAYECIQIASRGEVRLFAARSIFVEINDVISRPRLIHKYPVLTTERSAMILRSAAAQAEIVSEVPQVFRIDRDPDDDIFVNLAIAVKADYLVSRDKDLSELMLDSEFTSRYPYLKIVNPFEFLQAVRAK